MEGPLRALLVAGLCVAALTVPTPRERAAAAAEATTLRDYLTLRSVLELPRLPALGGGLPPLPAPGIGPRGLSLLHPAAEARGLVLHERAGPTPPGLVRQGAGQGAGQRGAEPCLLLLRDELAAGEGLAAALAGELGLPVVDDGAAGQSPLGHLGLLELESARRVALVVSVWNLANDLAETDLRRRVEQALPPAGDVDALVRELATPGAAAAQARWLAGHADEVEDLALVLAQAAFELDRRAALLGGRAALLLVPPAEGPDPATRAVLRATRAHLGDRVRFVELPPSAGPLELARAAGGG